MLDKMFEGKTSEELRQMQYKNPSTYDENMVEVCKYCGCVDFRRVDIDFIDLHVCEQDIVCSQCG